MGLPRRAGLEVGRPGTSLRGATFGPDPDRRSLLDRAHRGQIEGALGRLDQSASLPRRRGRILAFLAIMGPGTVVMVADNDAGSLATYAQAGQDYGFELLWLLVLLAGALYVIQEMVARLGAVTGAGHARLIGERFGPRWASFALWDLVALGALTVVTEFIGLEFGLGYLGLSRYIAVPAGAVLLLAMTATGSFRRWEQGMMILVGVSFVSLPLAFLAASHAPPGGLPLGSHAGTTSAGVLFAVGLAGTTLTPWQLFFHQSSVVDKRITSRWLSYEKLDTATGTFLFLLLAGAVLVTCAFAFRSGPMHGQFMDGGSVAQGLRSHFGSWAGTLFAIALIDGSLLGAGAVGLASSYAVGDLRGTRHSLHRRWRSARTFYGTYGATVVVAAAIVLALHSSLGSITLAVQALSGALFPSAAVFLLLLANDRDLLGPYVNPWWLNVIATTVVTAMLVLGVVLDITTTFRSANPATVTEIVAGVATGALLVAFMVGFRRRRPSAELLAGDPPRSIWSMPPIEDLHPPSVSRNRTTALLALRAYMILTVVSIVIRLVHDLHH